jgi:hypothetical protein
VELSMVKNFIPMGGGPCFSSKGGVGVGGS